MRNALFTLLLRPLSSFKIVSRWNIIEFYLLNGNTEKENREIKKYLVLNIRGLVIPLKNLRVNIILYCLPSKHLKGPPLKNK